MCYICHVVFVFVSISFDFKISNYIFLPVSRWYNITIFGRYLFVFLNLLLCDLFFYHYSSVCLCLCSVIVALFPSLYLSGNCNRKMFNQLYGHVIIINERGPQRTGCPIYCVSRGVTNTGQNI